MDYDWINIILIGVLVLATGYYAVQTHRQADLLKQQIRKTREMQDDAIAQERRRIALERIRFWAEDTYAVLTKPLPNRRLPNVCSDLILELHPYHIKCLGILSDAEQVGANLNKEISSIYKSLTKFILRLSKTTSAPAPLSDGLKKHLKEINIKELESFINIKELIQERTEALGPLGNLIILTTELLVPPQ